VLILGESTIVPGEHLVGGGQSPCCPIDNPSSRPPSRIAPRAGQQSLLAMPLGASSTCWQQLLELMQLRCRAAPVRLR
jgi:hypothetical protein